MSPCVTNFLSVSCSLSVTLWVGISFCLWVCVSQRGRDRESERHYLPFSTLPFLISLYFLNCQFVSQIDGNTKRILSVIWEFFQGIANILWFVLNLSETLSPPHCYWWILRNPTRGWMSCWHWRIYPCQTIYIRWLRLEVKVNRLCFNMYWRILQILKFLIMFLAS